MSAVYGRVAVITGGASGIGRGIAEELAAAGAAVVIADISIEQATATAAAVGGMAAQVDVADPGSMAALAEIVLRRHDRVDIVVNNAGVGPSGPIAGMTLADWRWLIDVNLLGVIHGVHTFLPLLDRNAEGGHIVNTSSMSAFAPMPGLGGYAVTKAGVTALTEVLAEELEASSSKVRACLLAPGPVDTGIADSQRHRRPVENTGLGVFQQTAPASEMLRPRAVGRIVRRAIETDARYAITHPSLWPRVGERHERLREAFEAASWVAANRRGPG